MFIFYDLIFLIVALVHLPVYLFRGKFHRGFLSRLGFLPADLKLEHPIWIHAVSVGEVMAIKRLVEELRAAYPEKKFVISTVTPTGNKIARNLTRDCDLLTYLPFDIGFIVKRVIDRIDPSLFVIAETELWPNLIFYLSRKNIPIVVVNGRISDSSFQGYSFIKLLLKPVLNRVRLFCVQTSSDAQRLMRLGVLEEKIRITGNMKFDAAISKIENSDLVRFRQNLGLVSSDRLFVCGSTHPGEEEVILGIYKELRAEFPGLKLLVAPRHPERSRDVAEVVSRSGFDCVFISALNSRLDNRVANAVFILDSIGELRYYYAIAEIVFVGGSLVKKGGQNILEPACLERPILFGPYMFNFKDIAELFLTSQGAVLVKDRQELKTRIREILINPSQAQQMGQKAKQLILNNAGSTHKNLELIRELVEGNFVSK